jgi:Protein of unknown function (DUF2909)
MQLLIVVLLVAIVGSLGHALFSMTSGPDRARQMANALTVRITISVALFLLILVGNHFGWITPHAVH